VADPRRARRDPETEAQVNVRNLVTVSNALVCAIVDGIPVSDDVRRTLIREAGLAEPALRDITARTSIVRLAKLWKRVLRVTNDPFVGLHIGSSVRAERFGLGAHAAQHGETFRQVLLRFSTYAALINDLLECRLEETASIARFTARLHWNVLGLERHAVDITLAGVAKWTRDHLATPLALREVRLKHTLVAGERAYRATFAAPIVFGANRYELVFDAAALDEPVAASDRELGLILERYAALELSRIAVAPDLPAHAAQVVRRRLEAGDAVELAAIASALDTTPRSLQRKLRAHGTSLSGVVDDVRRSLAPTWLADPDENVEQVGFRLGYSEPTAFIRAFKKWYGMTPGAYRKRGA
jgi:AraC-like DNA-binding protein